MKSASELLLPPVSLVLLLVSLWLCVVVGEKNRLEEESWKWRIECQRLQTYRDELKCFAWKHLLLEDSFYHGKILDNKVLLGMPLKVVGADNPHDFFFRVPILYVDKTVGYIDVREFGEPGYPKFDMDGFQAFRFSFMRSADGSDIGDFKAAAEVLPKGLLDVPPGDIYRFVFEKLKDEPVSQPFLQWSGDNSKVAWAVKCFSGKTVRLRLWDGVLKLEE